MIGAHPDDENTRLIAYLAKARHIETAYLSLTRGDGGQNLIGNQLGAVLGMIRTEELLAARRIDGGRQYFTRAFDFGFSKTIDETYQHWPKDSILKDAVEIVRAFRPQVIIAVFTGTPADGHGHHQFSGVIARAVYDAAADTIHFPASRVGGLKPWAAAKFYRLRRGASGSLTFDVGEFDQLLGESYSEIATVSRSQHRSQGQGALPQRGPRYSGVQLEASRVSDPKARGAHVVRRHRHRRGRASRRFRSPIRCASAIDSLASAEAAVTRSRDLAASGAHGRAAGRLRAPRDARGERCDVRDARRRSMCADGDVRCGDGRSRARAVDDENARERSAARCRRRGDRSDGSARVGCAARHGARRRHGVQPRTDSDLGRERIADGSVGDGAQAAAYDSARQQCASDADVSRQHVELVMVAPPAFARRHVHAAAHRDDHR